MDVEIREHAPLGHQRQNPIEVGIGVDIVEAHPDA
jgi:hypothetical protein